eukprot:6131506-Pyramimonas_sp.AAC.2
MDDALRVGVTTMCKPVEPWRFRCAHCAGEVSLSVYRNVVRRADAIVPTDWAVVRIYRRFLRLIGLP